MPNGNDPVMEQTEQALDAVFEGDNVDLNEQADTPDTPNEGEPDQPVAESEDTFTGLDPNALPEAVKPFYNSMLADYTRKTQELSETRKQYEALEQFGGPDVAMEAINFAYRLETDPNFAMDVHGQLTQALEAQGMSPAQAQAEAGRQMNEMVDQPTGEPVEDWEDGYTVEEPYNTDPRVDTLTQRLAQVEAELQWKNTAEAVGLQERALQQEHPDWTENDWENVYKFGYYTQGNLVEAAKMYDETQNRWLANYLSKKGTVDNKAPEPVTSAPGEETTGFDKLSDPSLERAFMKMVEQYGG